MPQRSGFGDGVGSSVADGVNVKGVVGGNGAGVYVSLDLAHGGDKVPLWVGVERTGEVP